MNPALWAASGATAALLLVLVGVGLGSVLRSRRSRARDDAALASERTDVDELRARVEELTSALATAQGAAAVAPPQVEYVITDAGSEDLDLARVPERAVLSVTLGEPLVKAAALGYGLRRALSAESRNRIVFAMRREVKRARKERRRAARRARVHEARAATAEEAA